jgi:hypothetical protein
MEGKSELLGHQERRIMLIYSNCLQDNANAPVLTIALELSNKNVHVLSYGSYDGDNSEANLIIKNT